MSLKDKDLFWSQRLGRVDLFLWWETDSGFLFSSFFSGNPTSPVSDIVGLCLLSVRRLPRTLGRRCRRTPHTTSGGHLYESTARVGQTPRPSLSTRRETTRVPAGRGTGRNLVGLPHLFAWSVRDTVPKRSVFYVYVIVGPTCFILSQEVFINVLWRDESVKYDIQTIK